METNRDTRAIMYRGLKSRKWDNVNGVPERTWDGAGAIVEVGSRLHAEKLLTHPDEFVDVTHLSEEERIEVAKRARVGAQERDRELHAPTAMRSGGTLLEYATDEQIQAEIDRRRRLRAGDRPEGPQNKGPEMSSSRVPVNTDGKKPGEKEFLAEKVADAVNTIITAGDADALDENGVPKKAAIEELIGFSLTDQEFADALGTSGPAEPFDKTEGDAAA